MTWSALESSIQSDVGPVPTMKLSSLQNAVELVGSPGILPAVMYVKASRSVKPPVLFVFLVSMFALLSPIAVSPIYRTHIGGFFVNATLIVGGGVGPDISSSLSVTDLVPGGVATGRALISDGVETTSSFFPATYNVSVAPFLPQDSVQAIWSAQVKIVVARNSLDCGPSAPLRVSNSSQDIVTIDPFYFGSGEVLTSTDPVFAGQDLGSVYNDPVVTAVYLNASTGATPGSVEANATVIFFAANGTLEGAQQTITSPDPTARIAFIDILVCTSTTRLEISQCTVDRSMVTNCDPVQPSELPSNVSLSATGGVEMYIANPESVAITLAVSPVTAYYRLGDRLPMYNPITPEMISSQTLPLSYLTGDITSLPYDIPLPYITDVLFGQTAQGLVQGMLTAWSLNTTQPVEVTATFGTSNQMLIHVINVLGFMCALIATISGTILPLVARKAVCVPLDVARLMAISRNPQVDATFEAYVDRDVEIGNDLLDNTRVGYQWVDALRRRALVLGSSKRDYRSSVGDAIRMSVFSGARPRGWESDESLMKVETSHSEVNTALLDGSGFPVHSGSSSPLPVGSPSTPEPSDLHPLNT